MLSQALLVFVCQFSMIFLLGIQSLNVRDGKKLSAAITSLLLGITGWFITGTISSVYHEGMLSMVFFAFILSGPLGISFSIWLHAKFKGVQLNPHKQCFQAREEGGSWIDISEDSRECALMNGYEVRAVKRIK